MGGQGVVPNSQGGGKPRPYPGPRGSFIMTFFSVSNLYTPQAYKTLKIYEKSLLYENVSGFMNISVIARY